MHLKAILLLSKKYLKPNIRLQVKTTNKSPTHGVCLFVCVVNLFGRQDDGYLYIPLVK